MGYRSDVRIMTTKKGFKELKKFNDKYLADHKNINGFEEYNLMNNLNIKKENKYSVYFGWDWLKWYEGSYAGVDAIVEGLNHLEEKDLSYRFARMGENYDDFEESYYESEKEEEQDLEYPSMIREFDDDYISELMDKADNMEVNVEL